MNSLYSMWTSWGDSSKQNKQKVKEKWGEKFNLKFKSLPVHDTDTGNNKTRVSPIDGSPWNKRDYMNAKMVYNYFQNSTTRKKQKEMYDKFVEKKHLREKEILQVRSVHKFYFHSVLQNNVSVNDIKIILGLTKDFPESKVEWKKLMSLASKELGIYFKIPTRIALIKTLKANNAMPELEHPDEKKTQNKEVQDEKNVAFEIVDANIPNPGVSGLKVVPASIAKAVVYKVKKLGTKRRKVSSSSSSSRFSTSGRFVCMKLVTTHKKERTRLGDNSAINYLTSKQSVVDAEKDWNPSEHWPWRKATLKCVQFSEVVKYFMKEKNIEIR